MSRERPILFRDPNTSTSSTQTEEETEKQKREEFSVDCYLLDYTEEILSKQPAFNVQLSSGPSVTIGSGATYFSNTSFGKGVLAYKTFSEILASLSGRKNLKELGELSTAAIATMYPVIKLFRIDSGDGGKEKKRQFVFNKNLNDFLGKDKIDANMSFYTGCGIKNLSYTLAGTNPVEAERAIDVSITFVFSSVQEFLGNTDVTNVGSLNTISGNPTGLKDPTDKEDPDGNKTSIGSTSQYITLIQRPNPNNVKDAFDAKDFRLQVELSYSLVEDESIYSQETLARLREIKLLLDLSLATHELSFTEEGSLELKVNYYGSLQQYMNDPETDYFYKQIQSKSSSNTVLQNAKSQREEVEEARKKVKNCGNDVDKKALEDALKASTEANKAEQAELQTVKSEIYGKFIEDLYNNSSLFTFTVQEEMINEWIKFVNNETSIRPRFGATISKDDSSSEVEDAKEEAESNAQSEPDEIKSEIDSKREKKVKLGEELSVTYFYFGDLLQSITKVYDMGSTNNRILLGDIEYVDDRESNKITKKYNIGEVPISTDLFQAWFLEKIIKPGKTSYRLDTLIRDLVNGLLRPALDPECIFFGRNINKRIDINFTNFTIESSSDPVSSVVNAEGVFTKVPTLTSSSGPLKTYNYFCIFSTEALCGLNGNIQKDEENGIMHLYVGKALGLVTSIKFKRIDQPYAKEAKATREGFTPLSSLRDIYNCDINMIGNHIFYPGMTVFIHPPYGFGDPTKKNQTFSNIMGVGGYYNIIKITTDIADGKHETRLDCFYQSSGDGSCKADVRCK